MECIPHQLQLGLEHKQPRYMITFQSQLATSSKNIPKKYEISAGLDQFQLFMNELTSDFVD